MRPIARVPQDEPDGLLAERAWCDGHTAEAIEAADRALAAGADPGCLAAGVAAAGAAADGALLDAAERWRGIATALGGVPGAVALGRAALTASLVGDVQAVERDVAGAREMLGPAPGPLGSTGDRLAQSAPRGLTVLLDGVDAVTEAVRGGFDQAARRLAGLGAATVPADALAPARWDDLAVTVVVAGGGDDATARDRLAAYSDRPTIRRQLLQAWLDLRAGRLTDARKGIAGIAAGGAPILRCDAVLAAAITVGLARRAGDDDALRKAWHRVAPVVAGADVELLLLDAWGELSAGAARVSPIERDTVVAAMTAAAARAGTPSWCVATQAWWKLQRAAAAEDAAEAAAAAEQLATLTERGDRVRPRAAAAVAWASILSGAIDPCSIEQTATALANAGQPWEAASLCGAASSRLDADQADQAAARKRLLVAGREFRAKTGTQDQAGSGGLSSREIAVGRLLLDGLTYKQIGARLYISPKTVEQHVARIRQKLLVSNRSELIVALRTRLTAR